jgi:hypothetical protein
MFYDMRNIQFATILTELSNHEMTSKMKDELEIVKLTVMNIGRQNSLDQGDDPNLFTDSMGALSLLMMAAHWMIETDLLSLDEVE